MRALFFVAAAMVVLVSAQIGVAQKTTPDKVKIISVKSEKPVVRGVENEFTIEVEYNLETADEGELNMGFNLDRANAFRMVDTHLVQKGQGVVTLKAKVIPPDWEEKARFTVMVNLSKHPHGMYWRTLAGDRQEIAVGIQ
jgi:hypothetical protein